MKTEFTLDASLTWVIGNKNGFGKAKATIIGKAPENKPYVSITLTNDVNTLADIYIKDKDLELFAVNILKALNSKRVLQGKIPYHKLKKYRSIKQ